MIFDREKQRLRVGGEVLTRARVAELMARGKSAFDEPMWNLLCFLGEWFSDAETVQLHTSGSTGTPKTITARKEAMMESARMTCEALDLKAGDRALLCMNLRYIGAKMVVVRALVAELELVVRVASGHPLKDVTEQIRFTAIVPLQLYNSLQNDKERRRLAAIDKVIVGGGAVDAELERAVRELPNAVYSTYGMTETLSHIALRRLNGRKASLLYTPFAGIGLSLSEEETLVIDAPMLCGRLETNDRVRIHTDGRFEVLGRRDNVINSGGVKIQIEEDEKRLRAVIRVPFALTSVENVRLGQAVVLLVTGDFEEQRMEGCLPKYHLPRYVWRVDRIPETGNGKIDRGACRQLAERLLKGGND